MTEKKTPHNIKRIVEYECPHLCWWRGSNKAQSETSEPVMCNVDHVILEKVNKTDNKRIKLENDIPLLLPTPTKETQANCPFKRKNGQACVIFKVIPFGFKSHTMLTRDVLSTPGLDIFGKKN